MRNASETETGCWIKSITLASHSTPSGVKKTPRLPMKRLRMFPEVIATASVSLRSAVVGPVVIST